MSVIDKNKEDELIYEDIARLSLEYWKDRALRAEEKLRKYSEACNEVFGRKD